MSFEGRPNDEVAAAHGIPDAHVGCICGHGLTWHDTADLHCEFTGSWRSPWTGWSGVCNCQAFLRRHG